MRYVRNTQCGAPNGRLNERNWRNLSTLAEPCNGEGCAHPSRRSATTKLSFQGWLSRDNENRPESASAAQATVCLSRPVKTASPNLHRAAVLTRGSPTPQRLKLETISGRCPAKC